MPTGRATAGGRRSSAPWVTPPIRTEDCGDSVVSATTSSRAAGTSLSRLADECIARALSTDVPLAVMAMGKYGGDELNYASDIDVLFVVGDADPDAAERAGRDLIATMNGLFRVDADLRPEGRDGPLVRSLDSYRA